MTENDETIRFDGAASLDRRDFLWHAGGGFGALALAHLMGSESLLADSATGKPLRPRPEFNGGLHHLARAKRVVQLFMSGAASQCDTFDYKPALIQKNGQKFDPGRQGRAVSERARGGHGQPLEMAAIRPVRPMGQRSRAAPGDAASTTSRSCRPWSPSPTCTGRRPSCRTPASCCRVSPAWEPGSPMALGSLSQNLPTFVVLPDSRGFAPNGPANWSAGFLPAAHQGTMVRPGAKNPIFDLFPPEEAQLDPRGPDATAWSS